MAVLKAKKAASNMPSMLRSRLQDMMYVSLFTSFVCLLAVIPIFNLPYTSVPITAQTFGVMLAGALLGANRAGLSLLLFLCLVAVGAPVLSGFRGGIGMFFMPSGGFLMSWPLAAWVIGFLVQTFWRHMNYGLFVLFNIIGGIIVIYAAGIPYHAFVTELSLQKAAILSMSYLPGDLLKVFLASYIALKIKQSYPLIRV